MIRFERFHPYLWGIGIASFWVSGIVIIVAIPMYFVSSRVPKSSPPHPITVTYNLRCSEVFKAEDTRFVAVYRYVNLFKARKDIPAVRKPAIVSKKKEIVKPLNERHFGITPQCSNGSVWNLQTRRYRCNKRG